MDKIIFVISNGVMDDLRFLDEEIRRAGDPVLICTDGAARRMKELDRVPDMIVGDMDSVDEATLKYFEQKGSRIIRHSEDKDETDTQLALESAFEMNPDQIRIFGALGGRIDHELANISLLVMCAKSGIDAKIVDKNCELFVIDRSCVIDGREGETVSLIPMSSDVRGITLEGFRYPLSDGVMEIGRPYGVSNRLAGTRGSILVKSGYLLIIRQLKV
ncbi:MAG: thiamine diphosphokinase [Deltaproteobacteria bacterium]|nr:thiamine diphosphokinase [Deltaproteobacteria bacterium]MBW2649581.1 thiamine diphosphokinase [Deltaproteobacteria bacterium]